MSESPTRAPAFVSTRFGDTVPPTRYRPDIPQWLENALLRAVARDTRQRFETAEELLLALERGETRPVSPPQRTPLWHRHPAARWQAAVAILLVINLLLLYLLLVR